MLEVKVTGAHELAEIQRRLKETGDKGLKRELSRAISSAVKPLKADVVRDIPNYMPAAYARELQPALQVRTGTRSSASNPGIRLTGSAKGRRRPRSIAQLDRGVLRHPLFGNREHWFTTRIRSGFWTDPLDAGAPKVRAELREALQAIARRIASRSSGDG